MIRGFGRSLAPAASFALAVTVVSCGGSADAGADDLAAAGSSRLSVQEAAEMLASQTQLPAQPEVVLAVGDLWIDYSLLARAASEDPDLGNISVDNLAEQRRVQVLVERLRDEVILVDTAISEAQLEEAYLRDQPGLQIRASHILLNYPDGASQEQRDSVDALAGDLANRARGGEDFAALAREYSRDPGTAGTGGDLGFFTPGSMVKPFDDAAFAMEVNEVSDPVVTPFGVHVIRVTDRTAMPLDSIRDQYRLQLQSQLVFEAESTYVASVRDPAEITVTEEAASVARELANDPNTPLRGRAADRELVTYVGGGLTAGEMQAFLQGNPPALRNQVATAPDDQVDALLSSLAQTELLAMKAEEAGIEYSQAEADSVALELQIQLRNASDALGIRSIVPEDGETDDAARERAVLTAMEGILAGRIDVVPLGPVSFSLRERYGADLNEDAVEAVLAAVQELRGSGAAAPAVPPSGDPSGTVPPADGEGGGSGTGPGR
jgi:hypothetical protein